ncbi:MAG: hypothetical protein E7353_03115 [Clostridiales bacterium]|nr:hypothetical protein [Clostridiales bacterium]
MLKKILKKYSSLKFKISPLFIVYALVFTFLRQTYEGLSYIIALIIHEFAHAEEAKKRGYILNSMNFTVFGASLKMQAQTMKREDERAIALAGPLVNLYLAIFCTALWWTFPSTYFFTIDFVWANVSLLLFNLLPVYPLDGGRILYTVLLKKLNAKQARKVLKISGYIISCILFTLFIIALILGMFNPSFLVVGIFTTLSTLFPENNSRYERLYHVGYRSEKLNKGIEIKEIAVNPQMTINNAYKMLSSDRFTCFVVVDKDLIPSCIIPETYIEQYYDKAHTLSDIVHKIPKER